MPDLELLSAFAQIALGLAGFSGVAIVLTHRGAALARFETYRLGIMLGSSLGAVFLSLLPLVIQQLGASDATAIRTSAAFLACYALGLVTYFVYAIRYMRVHTPEIVSGPAVWTVIIGYSVVIAVQIAIVSGFERHGGGVYLLSVFWMLVHAAYQFGRMLFIRPDMRRFEVLENEEPPVQHTSV